MHLEKPRRVLAVLFWAWAAFQAVGAVREARAGPEGLSRPGLYWLVMALLVAAYLVGGALLWRTPLRGRALGIVLALLALIAFPLGTLLGVVALVDLLRRKPLAADVEVRPVRRRRRREGRMAPPPPVSAEEPLPPSHH